MTTDGGGSGDEFRDCGEEVPDLTLVSTDDLMDEVSKRSEAMIFAAYQNRSKDDNWYIRRWSGGNIPALGLARFIGKRIEEACDRMDQYEGGEEPPDG